MKETYTFKHLFFFCFFLIFSGGLSAQFSNVKYEYSCPCRLTVTYDLADCGNVVLYYSPDTTVRWMVADTFKSKTPGNHIVDVWNCEADSVNYGLLYFKLEWVNNPDAVQINGVCWATRNVDAPGTFVANPTDVGMMYQWDHNIGWRSPMISYPAGNTWDRTPSSSTSWRPAPIDPSPAGFRVPTQAEVNLLLDTDAVTREWETLNGVKGCRFTDKLNNNSIFLPATGARNGVDGALTGVGTFGGYWRGTQFSSLDVWQFAFDSSQLYTSLVNKSCGYSVRPVTK